MEDRLSDESLERVADRAAKELAVLASNANVSVQSLFDYLDKRLVAIERKRAKRMDVESPT